MTTDTPRTDAVQFQKKPISLSIENEMLRALSREIERELTASQAEVERLRGIANRAISTLIIVTYGEETIDFGWPDIMRKVGELRNEFPFLGSTTEDSSVAQS